MQKIVEITKKYLAVRNKYRNDENYDWEEAYLCVQKLANEAYSISERCRTPEHQFIVRAVYRSIKEEEEYLYRMAYNFKRITRGI